VLAQELPEGAISEVVLVDDGSDDDGLALALRYAPPARVLRQENRGAVGAANTGVQEARGEYVAFCDSDDIWLPGKLAAQLTAARGGADLVFAHVEEFLSPEVDPAAARTRPLRTAMPGYVPSCALVRRALFQRVGPFDESLENGAWLDWYVRARAAALTEVVLEPVFVRRRIHTTNNWALQQEAGVGYLRALRSWVHHQRGES
jgi:glycosyltransferase involved in cell wall biosynthesis